MKRESFLSIFFIFVSISIVAFLIYPKFQNLSVLKTQILQKENQFENLKNYYQQIKETSEKLQNYQESLSKIDFALPEDPLLSEFFNFIQKLSSVSGLSLDKIDFIPPLGEEKLKEWKVNLVLKGDYPSFKIFLSSLEKSARLVEVENISFSEPKEKEPINFNLLIKIRSY